MWTEKKNGKIILRERIIDPQTGIAHKYSVTVKKDTPSGRKEIGRAHV